MFKSGKSAEAIVKEKELTQITDDSAIRKIVEEVVAANPDQAEQYKGGKLKLIGFFVGQVMKTTKGQANPNLVNSLLKEILG